MLLVASLNCSGAFSVRSEEPTPTIRIRVFNYATATPTTVLAAERSAGKILRDAGLNVVWLQCWVGNSTDDRSAACQQPLLPTEVLLRVLSDHSRTGIPDDAFGFAVPPMLASVYYEHAARLARIEGHEVTPILACVMVDEIGHLMLRQRSHSESGIMQEHWVRRHLQLINWDALKFTPEQSRLINAEGQRRMMLETSRIIVAESLNSGPAPD